MDPAALAPSNPRYEIIKDAAQLLHKEILFICYANDYFFPNRDEENEENGDLEVEMLFLRSTVEYFYRTGLFPFAFPEATVDFTTTGLIMPQELYIKENQRYREKFKNRVLKICSKLEPLGTIREQDAFELGSRIWGAMSIDLMKKRLELEQQEGGDDFIDDFPSSFSSSSPDEVDDDDDDDDDDKDDDGEKLMNGVLEKYPVLKRAIRLSGGGAKMPEVLKEVVEKGAEKLGEERVNEMDEQWKAVQLEKLQRFMVKITAIRIQANDLLDELQSTLD